MGKYLTIDELKSLQPGDWVWLVDLKTGVGMYVEIDINYNPSLPGYGEKYFVSRSYKTYPNYDDYGIKWVAYKNKEASEGVDDVVGKVLQDMFNLSKTISKIHPMDVIELAEKYGVGGIGDDRIRSKV